jgi:hypothetical protein
MSLASVILLTTLAIMRGEADSSFLNLPIFIQTKLHTRPPLPAFVNKNEPFVEIK